MYKHTFYQKLFALIVTGILLITTCVPVQAGLPDGNILTVASVGEAKGVLPDDILYQEDFEDKDLTASDPNLLNGLTWSSSGPLASETLQEYICLRMNSGAYILSDQTISQPEYTVSFNIINYYNTAAMVYVAYQDKNNYRIKPLKAVTWSPGLKC